MIPQVFLTPEYGARRLNPSHKGKGDSLHKRKRDLLMLVLILVIKEREIPISMQKIAAIACLNPSHKGKGDSLWGGLEFLTTPMS